MARRGGGVTETLRFESVEDPAVGEGSRAHQAFMMEPGECGSDLGGGLKQAFFDEPPMDDAFDRVLGGGVSKEVLEDVCGKIRQGRGVG